MMKYSLSSKDRFFLYLLAIPLLLMALIPIDYSLHNSTLSTLEESVETSIALSSQKIRKQEHNNLLKKLYTRVNASYLANNVENIELLKKEKESLSRLSGLQVPGNDPLLNRLRFLQNDNILRLTEKGSEKKEGVMEKFYTLTRPVEMDCNDLNLLLSALEEKGEGSPMLLLSQFKLRRKEGFAKNEVFEVNFDLFKREFINP